MKLAAPVIAILLLPMLLQGSSGSTSGVINEVVGDENMQIYVVGLTEDITEFKKGVNVEVVLKNTERDTRVFNPFFAKLLDSQGRKFNAAALVGTILPIRIASNDTLRGMLVFTVAPDASPATLVWKEFDGRELTVDLTRTKDPPDPVPSGWSVTPNKGKILSDGRSQLTVNDELLAKSGQQSFYLVDISIKNVGDDVISYTPSYSYIKDQDGNLYPPNFDNLGNMKKPLLKGELKNGEEVRGDVLFLVPDTVRDVMFIYDEGLGTGSYFAVPEFPYQIITLVASVGTGLLIARLAMRRPSA